MNERIKALKEMYPAGTKVRLVSMDDLQSPPVGTTGTVINVDDIGTIHIEWETGSRLGVCPEYDVIEKI